MKFNQYSFKSTVWEYPGKGGWFFVTVPQEISKDIHEKFYDKKRGFRSIVVEIIIGETTWNTSIFPDKKTDSCVFPIKAQVRRKENIGIGSKVSVLLEVI